MGHGVGTGQFTFGRFRVDVDGWALFRDGDRLPITRKAFATLIALLEHAGHTVSKQRLMDQVWPDTIVGEATLAQNVYTLRQALKGDEPAIETEPGVGYRFVLPVRRDAAPTPPRPSEIRSVAVLPFVSLDDDRSRSHLGLCLADALITRLSRLPDLVVRPSSAVFAYTDRSTEPADVGRVLGVDAILTGTLLSADGRVRANVQLVDVPRNAPLWAERFEVPFTDIFTTEDEISSQVMRTIAIPLGAEPPPRRPVHEDAYRAYVRGRLFWNERTREGLDRAMESFRYALAVDPDYAEAHAGLSDCYALSPIYADVPPHDSFPHARTSALRACELAGDAAEAHASLAYTRFLYDWQFAEAEAEFRRAIELDPGYATAHHWLATLLAAADRPDEARATIERALTIDPTSRVIRADAALLAFFAGRADDAVERCRRAIDEDEGFAYAHFVLSLALGEAGDAAASIAAAEVAVASSNRSTLALSLLGYRLGVAGEAAAARSVLDELADRSATSYVPAARRALVATGIGDWDAAVDAWRIACDERSRFVVFLRVWPLGDIRRDDRFRRLLDEMLAAVNRR